jgi:hypothetical protein
MNGIHFDVDHEQCEMILLIISNEMHHVEYSINIHHFVVDTPVVVAHIVGPVAVARVVAGAVVECDDG